MINFTIFRNKTSLDLHALRTYVYICYVDGSDGDMKLRILLKFGDSNPPFQRSFSNQVKTTNKWEALLWNSLCLFQVSHVLCQYPRVKV